MNYFLFHHFIAIATSAQQCGAQSNIISVKAAKVLGYQLVLVLGPRVIFGSHEAGIYPGYWNRYKM
jgi:hypothetical protein